MWSFASSRALHYAAVFNGSSRKVAKDDMNGKDGTGRQRVLFVWGVFCFHCFSASYQACRWTSPTLMKQRVHSEHDQARTSTPQKKGRCRSLRLCDFASLRELPLRNDGVHITATNLRVANEPGQPHHKKRSLSFSASLRLGVSYRCITMASTSRPRTCEWQTSPDNHITRKGRCRSLRLCVLA